MVQLMVSHLLPIRGKWATEQGMDILKIHFNFSDQPQRWRCTAKERPVRLEFIGTIVMALNILKQFQPCWGP